MKNLTATILIIFSQVILYAQCPPGDLLLFSSQTQINEFKVNYPNCTDFDGSIIITGSGIINLYGLSELNSIGGDLQLIYVSGLTNMFGLEGLTAIGGSLLIIENYTLSNLMGLTSLSSVGDEVAIHNNVSLTRVNALDSLSSVGLNLTSVGGDLSLEFNTVLNDLSALEGLTSIGGDLNIRSNYALTTLAGLDNIDAGSINNLLMYSNTSLSTCEVLSICQYLASPNGTITITNNATGCDNQGEIEDACVGVDIYEPSTMDEVLIYPNPATSAITVELPMMPTHSTHLTISNTSGQQLIHAQIRASQTKVDISHLPKGIYFVKVWDDENVMVDKVIKE